MGDLKLFAKSDQLLQGLLAIIKQFIDDIRMPSSFVNRANASFIEREMTEISYLNLDQLDIIKEVETSKCCKNLLIFQEDRIQHSVMRERIRSEYGIAG